MKQALVKPDGAEFFDAIERRMDLMSADYSQLWSETEGSRGYNGLKYWVGLTEMATERLADELPALANLLDAQPNLYTKMCRKIAKRFVAEAA